MRLFIAVIAATTSLAFLTSVAAAGADVRVTALDCESHPRRIRIENVGDAAQDLSGWQLQSDPVEGQPMDLARVGSLGAGKKFFVFEGHLSPPEAPDLGYYRWGSDENFNLRGNDSSDYVRIVGPQGNVISQRNCEGLPPGATPAPRTEFDPPPLVAAVTPSPTAPPGVATAVPASATFRPISANSGLPSTGGPPASGQDVPAALWLATGAFALAAGMLLTTLGLKRNKPAP